MPNSKPKLETTTTNPYAAAQPGIDRVLGAADKWYNGTMGRQAPLNADTRNALDMTRNLAGQPVAGLDQANQYNTNLITNGGYNHDLRQSRDYLVNFASGGYNEDPRLAKSIAERESRAMNAGATQFGGGRYGSAAIGQGMGSAMATAGNDLMLQSNENARNRQLQATGLMGQMDESARSATQQGMSMIPMLDNARYAGAERLAGVGDYMQNRAQERKDIPLSRLNSYAGIIGQMAGTGGTVTKPKAGSSAQSAIGGALAGAALGNKFLPGGWGTAIGGLGGGLLGWGS